MALIVLALIVGLVVGFGTLMLFVEFNSYVAGEDIKAGDKIVTYEGKMWRDPWQDKR